MKKELRHLGFDINTDYELSFDDAGDLYISAWFSNKKQPTEQEIAAVTKQEADDAEDEYEVKKNFDLDKKDKAIIKWIADLHGLSIGQAKQQLKDIYKAL